jgi:hypothetical protein
MKAAVGLDDDMDVGAEDEAVLRAMRPLMLVGRRVDGSEEEVGRIDAEMIRHSTFLTNMRWSDKTTERVVLDIYPELLHLLVRFARLVLQHNARAAVAAPAPANINGSAGPDAKNAGTGGVVQAVNGGRSGGRAVLPLQRLPPRMNAGNRAKHLPLVIDGDPDMAEFLNILAERPHCLYQCAEAAERLLWEPAQTAFLLKFGTILFGLSLPFMELIWPDAHSKHQPALAHGGSAAVGGAAVATTVTMADAELTTLHDVKAASGPVSATDGSRPASTTTGASVPDVATLPGLKPGMSAAYADVGQLRALLALTDKFFEVSPVTDKKLLPPTLTAAGKKRKRSIAVSNKGPKIEAIRDPPIPIPPQLLGQDSAKHDLPSALQELRIWLQDCADVLFLQA